MFGEYCTLVSDFTGADENPLSEGGNWAAITSVGTTTCQRLSNSVAAGGASGNRYAYWTPANFGPDLDAYVTMTTAGTGGIAARIQGEGGADTWDGYQLLGGGSVTNINRITNAATTNLRTTSDVTWASGDKFGIRCEGSTLQVWRLASGGSDWNLVLSVVDTTYASAGKVALYCSGSAVRLDDFYAGLPAEDPIGFRH